MIFSFISLSKTAKEMRDSFTCKSFQSSCTCCFRYSQIWLQMSL